ncbi:hypothetical protein M407DRAFT_5478 [Tulasnella calospora MUT 4182]|uniref:Uncharacterized protein n=1 Tax=Tulasnella calospora MUT 4182 TaxID=1051891 RepID=A0A0C3L9Y5_9AGAM|nr:hypothetical protein M407DRAFT_5478 [Tulasnella calospora MUT 4182]
MISVTPSPPIRPAFRTTFGTLLAVLARLPMARRHQRASTAILLVILFFSGFTLFTHHQQTTPAQRHAKGSGYRYAQHGMPFLRPSSYLMKRGGSDDGEPVPTFGTSTSSDSDGIDAQGEAGQIGSKQQQQQRMAGGPSRREYGFPIQERPVARNGWGARPPLPSLRLDPSEELAALVHFITAIPSNAITDVDPNEPIPAELLLDFNTRGGDRARAELENVVQSTWFEHPVVIFSLVHSPKAREVKKIIDSYKLLPKPVVIEVDERRDADIISPLLHRLTSSPTLPILLVGGKPAGTVDQIQAAHEDGSLKRLLAEAGAVIGGSEKKKKKKLVVQYSDEE